MDNIAMNKSKKKKKKHKKLLADEVSELNTFTLKAINTENEAEGVKHKKMSKHKRSPAEMDPADPGEVGKTEGNSEMISKGKSKKKKQDSGENYDVETSAEGGSSKKGDAISDNKRKLYEDKESCHIIVKKKKRKLDSDVLSENNLVNTDETECSGAMEFEPLKHKSKKEKKKSESNPSKESEDMNGLNSGENNVCTFRSREGNEEIPRHKKKKKKRKEEAETTSLDTEKTEENPPVDSGIQQETKSERTCESKTEVNIHTKSKKHKKKHDNNFAEDIAVQENKDANTVKHENKIAEDSAVHESIKRNHAAGEPEEGKSSRKKRKKKKERKISENDDELSMIKPKLEDSKVKIEEEECKVTSDSVQHKVAQVGQWSSANLGDSERQNKFFRLLGGFKKGNTLSDVQQKFSLGKPKGINDRSSESFHGKSRGGFAMDRSQEEKYTKCMEKDYERAMEMNMNRGIGLGFEKPADMGKKFHIDTTSSKSIKFDD